MMRCGTLKVSAGGVGQLLDYYAGLVEDRTRADGRFRGPVDYYLDPDEPAGRWWGRGLDGVGLSGEVTGDDLRSLLEGRHPQHLGALAAGSGTPSIALRAGDPRAVDAYAEHGRLFTAHPALLANEVARLHQRDVSAGRTVAITTNTAETARAINREIQRFVDPVGRRPRIALADGTYVSVGDQIATRRNDRNRRTAQHERVRNRQTWTVTGLDPASGALTASHPERGSVTLPAEYVGRHVELGWAVTGYGNQGDTVDVGVAILESGTTRNHAYAALTRGRQVNLAWMPDPAGTLNPAEQLADMISRTPDTASALATRDRLHRQAGLTEPEINAERNLAERARPEPIGPATDTPAEPALDERVRALQARLDRLQQRSRGRSLGR